MSVRLIHGDCLEEMGKLIDEGVKVDLVLTDPPYGTTACRWDSIIPLDKMWTQINQLCYSTTPILLFGMEPFSSKLRLSNVEDYKYDWIWRKPRGTGHLNANKQPLRDVENISVFYKKQCLYNPQFKKGTPYTARAPKKPRVIEKGSSTYGKFVTGKNVANDNKGVRYPKQVLEFGVVERGNVHNTQKPVDLLEYLIKTYTHPHDTVLDFTMGSGSTGVACQNLNRDFIGIELEKEYYKIAQERCHEYQSKLI